IPLNAALLDSKGGHVTPKGYDSGDLQITLDDSQDEIELALETGSDRPILSIARDFSAPIRLERELDVSDLLRLARAETDRFNKWDAFQTLLKQHLLGIAYRGDPINDTLVDAIGQAALAEQDADPAYAALLLRMPDVGELFQEQEPADPVALRQSCNALKAALSEALAHVIGDTLNAAAPTPYAPNAEQAGQRAFRACCMDLAARSPRTVHVLPGLFADASCMTEQQAALSAILTAQTGVEDALTAFYHQWQTNPIVIDKWFAVQARSVDAKSITELSEHPDFDLGNPNRVRAVAGVFAMQNLAAFHAPDGAGHAFLANIVRKADGRNPALAARLLTAFEQWRKLEPMAKQSAEEVLNSLAKDKLSPNADDIIKRALG
ncbi:MAG: aminopeptidase N C-terminal domain-containing protein, partial [Pseudomonadota bacterium]